MYSAQRGTDAFGEIDILLSLGPGPVPGQRAEVRDQIRKHNEPRPQRACSGAVELSLPPLVLRQGAAVGELLDECPNVGSKLPLELGRGHPAVLEHVAENCGSEGADVRDAGPHQHVEGVDHMVDEGRRVRVRAPPVAVCHRGEAKRLQQDQRIKSCSHHVWAGRALLLNAGMIPSNDRGEQVNENRYAFGISMLAR